MFIFQGIYIFNKNLLECLKCWIASNLIYSYAQRDFFIHTTALKLRRVKRKASKSQFDLNKPKAAKVKFNVIFFFFEMCFCFKREGHYVLTYVLFRNEVGHSLFMKITVAILIDCKFVKALRLRFRRLH